VRTVTLRVLPGAARVAARRAIVLAALLTLLAGVDARATGALPHQQAEAKLTASDESGAARLGYSVSLSADGNTALVGDPSASNARGGAWLFSRSQSTWTRQPELVDSEASHFARFGRSVALSGDGNTALIGGPGDSSFGAAWTFTHLGSAWTQGAKLTGGPSETEGGHFGKSVALSSDGATALVGAQEDSGVRARRSRSSAKS
jgi:hypothetical protein